MFCIILNSFLSSVLGHKIYEMLRCKHEKYYCEYMHNYNGICKSVKKIDNIWWNHIIVYHFVDIHLVRSLYKQWLSMFFLITKYKNRLESEAMRLFKRLKCTYKIWMYITDSSLNMPCVGIFVKHTLCSLYWNEKTFCKPEQRGENS